MEKQNLFFQGFIKKRVRSMLGLRSLRTATLILSGIEAMDMIEKRATSPKSEICPK